MDKNKPGDSQGQRGREKKRRAGDGLTPDESPWQRISFSSACGQTGLPSSTVQLEGLAQKSLSGIQMVHPLKEDTESPISTLLGNIDSPALQESLTVRMEASLVTSLTQFRSSDVTNEVFLKLILSIGRRRPSIYTENRVPLTWSQLQPLQKTLALLPLKPTQLTRDPLQPTPSLSPL